MLTEAVCDQCGLCAKSCPLGAFGETTTMTIAGKAMPVSKINYAICRSCGNGARGNSDHPAGRADRLGAICNRTCVHHLDQEKRIENAFDSSFRNRPAWQRDAQGKVSLVDGE